VYKTLIGQSALSPISAASRLRDRALIGAVNGAVGAGSTEASAFVPTFEATGLPVCPRTVDHDVPAAAAMANGSTPAPRALRLLVDGSTNGGNSVRTTAPATSNTQQKQQYLEFRRFRDWRPPS
jgi:hypothetical protein